MIRLLLLSLLSIATLRAAQKSTDPEVPLMAWFASHRLLGLRSAVHDLHASNKAVIDGLLANPGSLGWRVSTELAEWSAQEIKMAPVIAKQEQDRNKGITAAQMFGRSERQVARSQGERARRRPSRGNPDPRGH